MNIPDLFYGLTKWVRLQNWISLRSALAEMVMSVDALTEKTKNVKNGDITEAGKSSVYRAPNTETMLFPGAAHRQQYRFRLYCVIRL